MNTVEETLRNVSRRSKHDTRGSGSSTGADWSASAVRGPAQPTPVAAPAATSTAFARPQDITGPTRRQSSRDSVDSTGQHTPPDHADLLFKVLPCPLIPVFLLYARSSYDDALAFLLFLFRLPSATDSSNIIASYFSREMQSYLFIFIYYFNSINSIKFSLSLSLSLSLALFLEIVATTV